MLFFVPKIFSTIFLLIFMGVIIFFALAVFNGLRNWNRNNNSPRLSVPALIVSRRENVSHRGNGTPDSMYHSNSTYYVTFQVESGDRIELHVTGQEYGKIAEGDQGILTFQGTRFMTFERHN